MIHFKETPLTDNIVVLIMMEFERKFVLQKLEHGDIRKFKFETQT